MVKSRMAFLYDFKFHDGSKKLIVVCQCDGSIHPTLIL